jgi:methionyl aminopeptidase
MEKEIIEKYKDAGKVWKKAITLAKKEAKEGINLLELAKKVEKLIDEENCGNAFPINLSLNETAAHDTPKYNEERVLKKEDVLKIDIGVHKDGYICDGAITINLDNKHAKQIEANELALENAISVAKIGVTANNIGKEIENTLKEKGFNPVYNLGGHGLERFDIHSYPSLPNHGNSSTHELEEGAVAIEPFASTGEGFVSEGASVEIFGMKEGKNVRNAYGRKILAIGKEYEGLPFAERWLREKSKLGEFQFNVGIRELMKAEALETFPVLKEIKGEIVTQAEKSLLLLDEKVIVLGE